MHPLSAKSVRTLGVLAAVLADEVTEAVEVRSVSLREAAERGALLLAPVRSVSLLAVTAVAGLEDGLDDLAAGTCGWGGDMYIKRKLQVVPQTCCVEA